jgi:hypothetical protein
VKARFLIAPDVTFGEQRREDGAVVRNSAPFGFEEEARLPRVKRKEKQSLTDFGHLSTLVERAETRQELDRSACRGRGGRVEPREVGRVCLGQFETRLGEVEPLDLGRIVFGSECPVGVCVQADAPPRSRAARPACALGGGRPTDLGDL